MYTCKPRSISAIEAFFDNFLEHYRTKDQGFPTLDIDLQKEAFIEHKEDHEEEEDPFLNHQDENIDEDIKEELEILTGIKIRSLMKKVL